MVDGVLIKELDLMCCICFCMSGKIPWKKYKNTDTTAGGLVKAEHKSLRALLLGEAITITTN